ncbi:ubiquitin-like domain-containing protein [Streptomyces sp. NBC_01520]|uniref:ubiquitin-like domain-containing protein n=1 Tax=Streptomyces sp. NBC_01520 TaxID=2903892 RepID=UPI0038635F3C
MGSAGRIFWSVVGHSQGSHRAARGSRRAGGVPAPPAPRSLHEEATIVAGEWPGALPVHDPTVLDVPPVPRQAAVRAAPAGYRATPRRAGARRHRGAPERLWRLVPQALVVAVLAGGTTAFLAHDQAVRVSVDGTSATLHTFADDVGELLDAEGVTVGSRDTVAPAPGAGSTTATRSSSAGRYAAAGPCGRTGRRGATGKRRSPGRPGAGRAAGLGPRGGRRLNG